MNRPAWEAALSNEASTLARVDALAPLSTTPHHAAGPARLTASTVANRPRTEVHPLDPAIAHHKRVCSALFSPGYRIRIGSDIEVGL